MDFRSPNTVRWLYDTAERMEAEADDLKRRAADLRDLANREDAAAREAAERFAATELPAERQTERCRACGQPVIADGEQWRHILTTACEWRGGPAVPGGDAFAIPPNQVPPADPAGETLRDQEVTP